MKSKQIQKIVADARRSVSRKYGFRQSSYINFKVEGGYFFCLYFLTGEARLTVKPLYADDLWWDIWGASENKKEPMSLRGTGAYSLSGQVLATYEIKDTTDESKLERQFDQLFNDANAEMTKFMSDNPDADLFYPDESKMYHDPDRLLYLMALIHNDKKDEALAIIEDARKNKHRCMFQSEMFSDSYTYISHWCKSKSIFRLFYEYTLKPFKSSDVSENTRRVSAGHYAKESKRKPWYKLLPEWLYWLILAPASMLILFYIFDLHRRTLYYVPLWIWLSGCILFAVFHLISSIRKGLNRNGLFLDLLLPVTLGGILGIITVGACVGLFDVANNLFSSKPIYAEAIVTNEKYFRIGGGKGRVNKYLTVVKRKADNKALIIDNCKLYRVSPQTEVIIIYREGLFGIDVFDDFIYSAKLKDEDDRYDDIVNKSCINEI